MRLDGTVHDLFKIGGGGHEVDLKVTSMLGIGSVHIAEILRDLAVEDHTAKGRVDHAGDLLAVHLSLHADANGGVQTDQLILVGHHRLVEVAEGHADTRLVITKHREVVGAENHILRGRGNGLTVHRLQKVVRRKHQEARLGLSLGRQRHVDRHLVAVKVGVKGGTYQRVQLDGAPLDKHRLEGLNGKTVKRRRTVQKHRMLTNDILKSVPHLRAYALDLLLGVLDAVGLLGLNEALHHEGLKELKGHLLRQTALEDLEVGADNDNRTAGIVNALTQQVLTEAALLTAKHLGKRLHTAVRGTGHGLAAASVVNQSIDKLLKHTLLVTDNDIRRLHLDHSAEAVVTVDHAAIKLVKVTGRKAAAVKLDHRAKIRGDDRQAIEDHPLGAVLRLAEALHHLKALDQLNLLLPGGTEKLGLQLLRKSLKVDLGKKLLDRLGTHTDAEVVLIFLVVAVVLRLKEKLLLLKRRVTGIQDDVATEVEHALQRLRRQIEQKTHTGRNGTEVPDVRYGGRQLNMAHPLTADLLAGHLDTALFADLALIATAALIFTALALKILLRAKDGLAEETAALGLERAVIDGLTLRDLTVRPRTDHVGRCQADFDGIENSSHNLLFDRSPAGCAGDALPS